MFRAHNLEGETDQRGRRLQKSQKDKQRAWEDVGLDTLIPGEVAGGWGDSQGAIEARVASPALAGTHRVASMGTSYAAFTPGATPPHGEHPGGTLPTKGAANREEDRQGGRGREKRGKPI